MVHTSEQKGTVVGHYARVFEERRHRSGKLRVSLVPPHVAVYIMVWTEDGLVSVRGPEATLCIVLQNGRKLSKAELDRLLAHARSTYPIDSELDIVRRDFVDGGGRAEPSYTLKDLPKINMVQVGRRQKDRKPKRPDQPQSVTTPAAEAETTSEQEGPHTDNPVS